MKSSAKLLVRDVEELNEIEIFRGELPKSALPFKLCIAFNFSIVQVENFFLDAERLQRVALSNSLSWDSRLLSGLTRLGLEQYYLIVRLFDYCMHSGRLWRPPTFPVVDFPSPCVRVLRVRVGSDVDALTTFCFTSPFPIATYWTYTQIDFSNFLSVLAAKFLSSITSEVFAC